MRKDDLCFRGEPVGESGDARGMLCEEWDGSRGGGGVAGILRSSSTQISSPVERSSLSKTEARGRGENSDINSSELDSTEEENRISQTRVRV